MPVFYNRVQFVPSTSALADFIVLSASPGYRTPLDAAIPNGTLVSYTAVSADKTQWECGSGLYTTGNTTVARTTIRSSSNANLKINFVSAPTVWLTVLAEDINASGVTPGNYTNTNLTVGLDGRITAASSGSGGSGNVPAGTNPVTFLGNNGTGAAWLQGWLSADNPLFGNLTTSPRAAIQAMIDYGWANGYVNCRIPGNRAAGSLVLDGPIFVDPPANLRNGISLAQQAQGIVAIPSQFIDRGMTIVCDPGVRFDCKSIPNCPGVWIGTQNRNVWDGGQFDGYPGSSGSFSTIGFHKRFSPITCCAIAVASGNGGAIATTIRNVDVGKNQGGFYSGISFGLNGPNALAEGNHIDHCRISNVFKNFVWYNGQSFPNWIRNCTLASEGGVIFDSYGQDIIVDGGEYGTINGFGGQQTITGTVSTITGFTDFTVGGASFTNYTFTCVIPDTTWQVCPDGGFIFYASTLELPTFGLVPVHQIAYDIATTTATYKICPEWVWMYYTGNGVTLDSTNFNVELQAATALNYARRTVISSGGNVTLRNFHYEKEDAGILALQDHILTSVFTNQPQSVVDSPRFNSPIVGNATHGIDVVSRSWGWIRQGSGQMEFRNCEANRGFTLSCPPVIVGNTAYNNHNTNRMIWHGGGPWRPILRLFGSNTTNASPGFVGYDDTLTSLSFNGSKAGGFGEYDRNIFAPNLQNQADLNMYFKTAGGTDNVPMVGTRPASWALQRITNADVAAINAHSANVPICGGCMAVVADLAATTVAFVLDKTGNFWTWAGTSSLTITWNTTGGSHYFAITGGAHRNYLFAGLQINATTDALRSYVITGVDFDGTNITGIMVHRLDNTNGNISGTLGAPYNNTVFGQRVPSLSVVNFT